MDNQGKFMFTFKIFAKSSTMDNTFLSVAFVYIKTASGFTNQHSKFTGLPRPSSVVDP